MSDSVALSNVSQAQFYSDVITGTLDTLNSSTYSKSGSSADLAQSYNFNKDVLSSVYNPTGTVVTTYG